MKFLTALFLVLALVAALALARPGDDVFDFDGANAEHEQEGVPGQAVAGEYSFTAPNGEEFEYKYKADHLGFRLVD